MAILGTISKLAKATMEVRSSTFCCAPVDMLSSVYKWLLMRTTDFSKTDTICVLILNIFYADKANDKVINIYVFAFCF